MVTGHTPGECGLRELRVGPVWEECFLKWSIELPLACAAHGNVGKLWKAKWSILDLFGLQVPGRNLS